MKVICGSMTSPKVGVVVLNLNGADVLKECLASITDIDYQNVVVVIVDNGSTDGSPKIVTDEFPSFHLIENGKNLGVPEGQNIGIRYCLGVGSDFVFVLNNDLIIDRFAVSELLKHSADDSIGVSGPIVYSAQDPEIVQSAGGMIRWTRGKAYTMLAGQKPTQMPVIFDVDYMGLPFIKAEVLSKVGLYDSNYFAYWEDSDFCTRVKRAGYRVVSVASVKVWHKGSHTTSRMSGFVSYYMTRNRFRFMKMHATGVQYAAFLLHFIFIEFWLETMKHLANPQEGGSMSAFFRGTLAGLSSSRK